MTEENVAQTIGKFAGKVVIGGIVYGAVYGAATALNNAASLGVGGELVAVAAGAFTAIGLVTVFVR
jgi:hypothetical protein